MLRNTCVLSVGPYHEGASSRLGPGRKGARYAYSPSPSVSNIHRTRGHGPHGLGRNGPRRRQPGARPEVSPGPAGQSADVIPAHPATRGPRFEERLEHGTISDPAGACQDSLLSRSCGGRWPAARAGAARSASLPRPRPRAHGPPTAHRRTCSRLPVPRSRRRHGPKAARRARRGCG